MSIFQIYRVVDAYTCICVLPSTLTVSCIAVNINSFTHCRQGHLTLRGIMKKSVILIRKLISFCNRYVWPCGSRDTKVRNINDHAFNEHGMARWCSVSERKMRVPLNESALNEHKFRRICIYKDELRRYVPGGKCRRGKVSGGQMSRSPLEDPGVPWSTLEHSGLPWSTLEVFEYCKPHLLLEQIPSSGLLVVQCQKCLRVF